MIVVLASTLKRPELLVYLVFGPVSIAGKRSPQSCDLTQLRPAVWFFDSSHSSIFTHLSVFPPRHWPEGFFYQSPRSFGFPPPVPLRVRGFSLIDSPVFFHHLPLGFWRFFTYATPQLHSSSTYMLVGACVLEGR